jgi:hypothetical protein
VHARPDSNSQPRESLAVTGESAVNGGERHRRSHRSVRAYPAQRRWWMTVAALGASVLLWVLTVIFGNARMVQLADETQALQVRVNAGDRELAQLKPEIERLRRDLATLVTKRLPGLHPLVYDQVIALNHGYVKHIVFTVIKADKQVSHEYKLVMENETLTALEVDAELLLFDDAGIQVGSALVGKGESRTTSESYQLKPGEKRSYNARVILSRTVPPHYFLLTVR